MTDQTLSSRPDSNCARIALLCTSWRLGTKVGSDDLELVLRALDVKGKGTRDHAVFEASVPLSESLPNLDLVTLDEHRHVCSKAAKSRG